MSNNMNKSTIKKLMVKQRQSLKEAKLFPIQIFFLFLFSDDDDLFVQKKTPIIIQHSLFTFSHPLN